MLCLMLVLYIPKCKLLCITVPKSLKCKFFNKHFTYMIHSVRKLLWKGVGKSCFHCFWEKENMITLSSNYRDLYHLKYEEICCLTWWLTHRCCCRDQPGIGYDSKFLEWHQRLSSDQIITGQKQYFADQ